MKQMRALTILIVVFMLVSCSATDESADDATIVDQRLLSGPVPYRGVNLASAEFAADANGNGTFPGVHGVDYVYPDPAYASGYNSADYFIGKGMTTFRLAFRWERLQRTRRQALDATELGRLRTTVNRLTNRGAQVILDPHNYARYGTALIGSGSVPNADFADFWSRLATEFRGNLNVIFGLVNEPHDMPTEQWLNAANAAIGAIRSAGATNLILVPGNSWTGAHSWTQNWYGTPNSTAMLNIVDPGNHYAFEVHQYLDSDSSGTSSSCVSSTIGSQRMQSFTNWLRANGKKGFLGEFGGGTSQTCLLAIDNIVDHLEANADVYLGWTYWAAGPWWGGYFTSLEPSGGDKPQMDALESHLGQLPTQPSCTDGVRNGNETGVDCGGSCPACAASCTDGIRNGNETGVDCGGSCPACPASCTDGIRNGSETGVDCGGSCPACPGGGCQPKTYEAESMFHSTGGATPGGWNVWSNGYVSTNHSFAAGSTTIRVTASGTVAGGVWPRMTVSVGGTAIGSVNVTSTAWTAYSFTLNATSGSREVRVSFDNDAVVNGQDRNLLVDKIVVDCPATGATCTASPASYEAESIFHSTGGAAAGGWNIWSNGYISTNHNFPSSGTFRITVTASGTQAGAVWPHMVVSVGGSSVGAPNVTSTSFAPYTFTFTTTAGSKEIRVAFDNDAIVNGQDRNLLVDKFVIACP